MAKMNPSPAYLWYPKDMLSSGRVSALTALEELWYRRALDQSWLGDGIPADPADFAGWVGRGCTTEAAEKLIDKFFVPHRKDPDKVVNSRLEEERKNLQRKARQKSEAGKRGMANRWKQKGNSDNTVITQPNIPIAIAIATSKEKKEELPSPTASAAQVKSHLGIPVTEADLDRLQEDPKWSHLNVRAVFHELEIERTERGKQPTLDALTKSALPRAAKRMAEKNAPNSDHKALMTFLFDKFGPIPNPGAQGAAVKWLLEKKYTVEECKACFEDFMTDRYRADRVSWLMVKQDIGKWKANGTTQISSGTQVGGSNNGRAKPTIVSRIAEYDAAYAIFDGPAKTPDRAS